MSLHLALPVARAEEQIQAVATLWHLMNQARAHPLEAVRVLGIDEQVARQALGEDADILDTGLPPLAWNDKLYSAAWFHGSDMVTNGYFSHTSLDGSEPADRISAAGYPLLRSGELLGMVQFSAPIDPTQAAIIAFKNLLSDELDPEKNLGPNIFNRDFSEVGISIQSGVVVSGQETHNAYWVVVDLGQPAVYRVFLVGSVKDKSGQGLEGLQVSLHYTGTLGQPSSTSFVTLVGGVFQFLLPPGFLVLDVKDGSGSVLDSRFIYGGRANQLVDLTLH